MQKTNIVSCSVAYCLSFGCSAPVERGIDVPKAALLPEVSLPLAEARRTNTSNEYAMLISRYGEPDSMRSTEKDSPPPRVATRTAQYKSIHLNVVFAPNGCIATYEKIMEIVEENRDYPRLAQNAIEKLKPCVPSPGGGWTIVGYFDSAHDLPTSAEMASLWLGDPQGKVKSDIEAAKASAKRAADVVSAKARTQKAYLRALEQPVDPAVTRENLRRNRENPQPPTDALSDEARARRTCQAARRVHDDTPISELTPKQIRLMDACRELGY